MPHGFEGSPTAHRKEQEEHSEAAPGERSEEAQGADRSPISAEEVRSLIGDGRPVAAEQLLDRVADPRKRASLWVEVAAYQRAFDPREMLAKGRNALKEIADPVERAHAQRAFAKSEMENDLGLFAIEAVSDIDNPRERLDALGDLHEYFWGENGSRLLDPQRILDAAETAAKEMGDEGTSAEVLTKLALLSLGYRRGVAETFLDQIADPYERAGAYLTAADADRVNTRPSYDFLEAAKDALRHVKDVNRHSDLRHKIRAMELE